MVNLKINSIPVSVPENTSVLDAARVAGIYIPTLCYLKDVSVIGDCRVCLVESNTSKTLLTTCCTNVREGMEIVTNSEKVMKARKTVLELILSDHDRSCLSCNRNESCELQTLANEMDIKEEKYEPTGPLTFDIDDVSTSIVRNNNKCVLCRRCIAACSKMQEIHAIGLINRGYNTQIGIPFNKTIGDSNCVNCGQCIIACPTGALSEKDSTKEVWGALHDKDKYVIFQTAPSIRAALGEEFGMPIGSLVTGKMVAAIRRLSPGVKKVFDTDFGADMTIMEEGTELIHRIKNGGKLPMITSCSPGWVKFAEHNYHDFIENLSTCKSPHEMFGAIAKSYYAKKYDIDPANIYVVSVMPCTAKKFEAQRKELSATGYADVDAVITTRELGKMIREAGVDFINLADEDFDAGMGESTGAGTIFGATGGVMEAALRSVADLLTGKSLEKIDYAQVRGIAGVKEADVKIGDMTLHIGVANGTANAAKLLERVRNGEKFDFIEVMGCPGGCVTGGGQPHISSRIKRTSDPRIERAKALYTEDANKPLRKSHLNPELIEVYEEFLGEAGGHKAHELLHTTFEERPKFGCAFKIED